MAHHRSRRAHSATHPGQELPFPVCPPSTSAAEVPFSTREYQVRGVGNVVAGLRGGGRGQVHAACGTGKTKMAQWSAERLVPRGGVVVIVAPTVGLVAQTLAAWNDGHEDHVALAVCSDPSVTDDSAGRTEDILETVTTDPDVIDAWLRQPATAALRLIVGTHASAHLIGEGLQKATLAAELLVVDEAHRSSGSSRKQTALIHDDEVLPALRRLYMTATPRIWTTSRPGESSTLSMDDEAVFGPVLFRYPFSQAIAEGWLDDYRVAVIGVTRADVLAVLRRVAHRTGARMPTEHTAMVQAATARAAAQLGLRRVIAFCNRVEDAQRFARTFQDTIDALPERLRPARVLHADCVHGGMSQARRADVLATLAEPPKDGWTVISNARCLSEGIDVPTLDGVAFTEPKKSFVDIVQAIGRALRRDPDGNGTATIIVPILLADEQTGGDDDIDAGDFEVLWQVVRGLRAHDDTFSTALDACRADRFRPGSVLDRIDYIMPVSHQAPEFLEHLTVRLVTSATSTWWDGYAHLVDFHARWGHSQVAPSHVTDDGYKLGIWVSGTRVNLKAGRLSPDRVEALTTLDFVVDAFTAKWEKAFAVAAAYHAEHGHLRPPHKFLVGNFSVAHWLAKQRAAKIRGTLDAEREARLNTIGMVWATSAVWEDRLPDIRTYYAEHGRLPDEPRSPVSAAVSKVRTARARGELTPELIAELDAMGIDWQHHRITAGQGIAAARAFYAEHGHLRPPSGFISADGVDLLSWVTARRSARRAGTLSAAEIAELDEIAMVWDPHQAAWEDGLTAATHFHTAHGHLNVPKAHRGTGPSGEPYKLARFLHKQRSYRRAGTLPEDRIAALDALGMDWHPYQTRWDANLSALRAHHRQHGDIIVPKHHVVDGIDIGEVIGRARRDYASGALAPDRVAALEDLGIIWSPKDAAWCQMIAFLTGYHADHGHIPRRLRTPPGLLTRRGAVSERGIDVDNWLTRQRNARLAGELTDAQIADLDALGMVWEKDAQKKDPWRASFAAAQRFHATHGHLTVPVRNPNNARDTDALYSWVVLQRILYHRGTLADDRVALLETLDMPWNPTTVKQTEWMQNFHDVTALRNHYGHFDFPVASPGDTPTKLRKWLASQKTLHSKGELAPDRVTLLTGIGFDWRSGTDRAWDDAIDRLRTYRATVGDPNEMRTRYKGPDGFGLYSWLRRACTMAENGELPATAVQDLIDNGVLLGPARTRTKRARTR